MKNDVSAGPLLSLTGQPAVSTSLLLPRICGSRDVYGGSVGFGRGVTGKHVTLHVTLHGKWGVADYNLLLIT